MFVGANAMKAFEFDHRLIGSYARFSRSFSAIRSDDLKSEIDRQYDAGRFWPDALLSLNPRYRQGATVDDLVDSGGRFSGGIDALRHCNSLLPQGNWGGTRNQSAVIWIDACRT